VPATLPQAPAIANVVGADGAAHLALLRNGRLHDLSGAGDPRLRNLDSLLKEPREVARTLLEDPGLESLPGPNLSRVQWAAPVGSQEIWGAGVTYMRSREARMEEAHVKDIYARVYEAERPELFFKAAGWRVVPHGQAVGARSDSAWSVPEPELAVLSNSRAEVMAYSCGNDMSSRSIEGLNPLYLPQAKVYDGSCSIGPLAVLAWHVTVDALEIRMTITRDGNLVFFGETHTSGMVRDPAELVQVLHSVYTLPVGAWLLTGTGIVPPEDYSAQPGDVVEISIDGIGTLRNQIARVQHSGAAAMPRLVSERR
jgi:2-dehydro-3-deoxy-D-arabinonate dehydratase